MLFRNKQALFRLRLHLLAAVTKKRARANRMLRKSIRVQKSARMLRKRARGDACPEDVLACYEKA